MQTRFDNTDEGCLRFVELAFFQFFNIGDSQLFYIGHYLLLQKDLILLSFFQQNVQGGIDLLKFVCL